MQDHDEAIRLRPDLANAFNNRGDTRNAPGDREGAMREDDEAIRLQPDWPWPSTAGPLRAKLRATSRARSRIWAKQYALDSNQSR